MQWTIESPTQIRRAGKAADYISIVGPSGEQLSSWLKPADRFEIGERVAPPQVFESLTIAVDGRREQLNEAEQFILTLKGYGITPTTNIPDDGTMGFGSTSLPMPMPPKPDNQCPTILPVGERCD
jgi:hypothetical protein